MACYHQELSAGWAREKKKGFPLSKRVMGAFHSDHQIESEIIHQAHNARHISSTVRIRGIAADYVVESLSLFLSHRPLV